MHLRALAALVGVLTVSMACGGAASDSAITKRRRSTTPTFATVVPSTAPEVVTTRAADAPASPVDQLVGVGPAEQVIAVVADGFGATSARFSAYERDGATWRTVFGPWTASIGVRGFAPPDEKREGDGRTPSGSYGFEFFFGVEGDPGVKFAYRDVTGPTIVWDDDPRSPRYNLWSDTTTQETGVEPEPMYNRPAYNYGAVIAYNTARTAGLGSAIFLHVSTGGPTAGCVAIPQRQLLDVLRWLDPARQPRIIMGPRSVITA